MAVVMGWGGGAEMCVFLIGVTNGVTVWCDKIKSLV